MGKIIGLGQIFLLKVTIKMKELLKMKTTLMKTIKKSYNKKE